MAFAPIPEYEGKSPYVFITYAPLDERIAYSIAVRMYNEGFRLWSSAACGNPSTMRIAERLSNSSVAMVFLSRSYLRYASDKEFEPRAVMNSPKQKIVVCLDDTPLGTDWNTVDFPAGIRYNPDVPEGLWLRINSSDELEKCRGAWPKVPMPDPTDEQLAETISVGEDELTDELTSLNSVMSSFGAGLDDDEISNISLFRRSDPEQDKFRWPEKSEPTQEQEYYTIENLIDNSPMPVSPEKKQYDSMIDLIESFMQKSGRAGSSAPVQYDEEETDAGRPIPISRNTYTEYRPVQKNEFDKVDLSKDISSSPVVITDSDERPDSYGMPMPIMLDYGDETEMAAYSMTRNQERADRVSEIVYYSSGVRRPEDETVYNEVVSNTPPPQPEKVSPSAEKPVFETVVDDRRFIRSTEDNVDDAKLTFHLGSIFDGFDEKDYAQDTPEPPKPEPPKPEPPKPEPPKPEPADDAMLIPALSFEKPLRPEVGPIEEKPAREIPRRTLSRPRRRYIVSVRKGIRHIEYDEEMFEVNGRWIPGQIYHRVMPGAEYTAVRHINRPDRAEQSQTQPQTKPQTKPQTQRPTPSADSESRLNGAVSGFMSQPAKAAANESMPEEIRSVLRERHEARRNEGIRQFEESQAAALPTKNQPASEETENTPARKHKFSHAGGIKKSLMANMETPVNTQTEESHRQYGARAQAAAEITENGKKSKKKDEKAEKAAKKAAKKATEKAAQKKAESKKKGKDKDKDKELPSLADEKQEPQTVETAAAAFDDIDEDSLIEMPKKNLPSLSYDPAAFSSMNLSEILFGEGKDGRKDGKKKKKK